MRNLAAVSEIRFNDWGAPVLNTPFHGRDLEFMGSIGSVIEGAIYCGMWYKTPDGFNVYTRRRFVWEGEELIPTSGPVTVEAYKTGIWGKRIDLQI